VQNLRKAYPEHEIVSEIASGINWSRKKFNSLLGRAIEGTISEIVDDHQGRLCRFGFEFVVKVLPHLGVQMVVHFQDEKPEDASRELEQDLMSIVTAFVAKNNGKRAAENRRRRRRRRRETEEEEEGRYSR
jgi:putative resolvase